MSLQHHIQNVNDCPAIETHAASPEGYLAWHEWAERMSETHTQRRCPECGFWSIWEKRMTRSDHIAVDDRILFIDRMGDLHEAQVDHIWGDPDDLPTINVRCLDDYAEPTTSVQHRSRTDAPAFYWIHR